MTHRCAAVRAKRQLFVTNLTTAQRIHRAAAPRQPLQMLLLKNLLVLAARECEVCFATVALHADIHTAGLAGPGVAGGGAGVAAGPGLPTGPLTNLTLYPHCCRCCCCRPSYCRRGGLDCMARFATAVVTARKGPPTLGPTAEGSSRAAGQRPLTMTTQAPHLHRHRACRTRPQHCCCHCCRCSRRCCCRRLLRRLLLAGVPALGVTAAAAIAAAAGCCCHCCNLGFWRLGAFEAGDSWGLRVVAGAAAAGVAACQSCATRSPAWDGCGNG